MFVLETIDAKRLGQFSFDAFSLSEVSGYNIVAIKSRM